MISFYLAYLKSVILLLLSFKFYLIYLVSLHCKQKRPAEGMHIILSRSLEVGKLKEFHSLQLIQSLNRNFQKQ